MRVGTVLVVLLVLIAGCTVGGGADGDGAQGTSDGAGSATASSGAGVSDGSSGPSGGTTAEADGSSDGDGSGDEPVALEDTYEEYVSNLRESGSYTATYTWSMEGEEAAMNGSFEGEVRIDLESESAYMIQRVLDGSGDQMTVELFWPAGGDVVYTRYETGEGSFYQTSERNQSMLTLWTDPLSGTGTAPSAGTDVGTDTVGAYRDEGIVSTAEGPRRRYVVDDLPTASVEASSDGEVGEFYAEVLVDEERDIVTDYRLRMTSTETSKAGFESFEFELAYRDVGSTTVPTPEWLTEAKAQAG